MWTVLIIALSVSMDAFSLALLYGIKPFSNKQTYQLTLLVGLFHFIMPLLGILIGNIIIRYISVPIHIIIFLIFTFIGVDMILSAKEKVNNEENFYLLKIFLFAFTVSIDSFTVGIVLFNFTSKYFLTSFLFLLTSSFFTFIGLKLGNKINKTLGIFSTMTGGFVLIFIALFNLLALF